MLSEHPDAHSPSDGVIISSLLSCDFPPVTFSSRFSFAGEEEEEEEGATQREEREGRR